MLSREIIEEINKHAKATERDGSAVIVFEKNNEYKMPTLIMGGSALDLLQGISYMIGMLNFGSVNERLALISGALKYSEGKESGVDMRAISAKEFDDAVIEASAKMRKKVVNYNEIACLIHAKEMRKILFGSDTPK